MVSNTSWNSKWKDKSTIRALLGGLYILCLTPHGEDLSERQQRALWQIECAQALLRGCGESDCKAE